MPYPKVTLSEIINSTRADVESRLPGTYTRTVNGAVGAISYAAAANAYGLREYLSWISRQVVPHLSDNDILLKHCEFYGVARKLAGAASGTVTATIINATTIDAGIELQRADGTLFVTAEIIDVVPGIAYLPVVAVAEGVGGNTEPGVVLKLVSPVAGVNSNVVVSDAAIGGGTDIESMDSLRARLVFRVQYPPSGGTVYDYIRWAREVAGVTRAWCLPAYRGAGSVAVMFVLDDMPDIFPSGADIQRVHDYISGHTNPLTNQPEGKPPGVELIVIAPIKRVINPVIRVVPGTDAVKAAVMAGINNLISGIQPGGTLLLSQFRAAVSSAKGEIDNTVIYPDSDIHAGNDELFVLGNITWE